MCDNLICCKVVMAIYFLSVTLCIHMLNSANVILVKAYVVTAGVLYLQFIFYIVGVLSLFLDL